MLERATRLLAATLLVVASWSAHAQPDAPLELKVSHYLPPNHTVQKVLEDWAQEIEARSAGRLKLRLYPAAQLGPCSHAKLLQAMSMARKSLTLVRVGPVTTRSCNAWNRA